MRLQLALALIGALSVSLPASAANVESTPTAAAAAGAATGGVAASDDFEDLQGFYQLADGRELRVFSARNKLYAKLGTGVRTEIVPVAAHTFAAPNGSLRIEFADRAYTVHVTAAVAG